MSVLWYLVPPGYCEIDVLDMYRVLMTCVTMGGGSFALCLFPSGQAYALARCRASSSRLRRHCRCCPAALVCASAACADGCGYLLRFIAELSVEFLVYYCVHNLDGNMVLVVFVFMMQGQGKAQFGIYPSCTRRHAHPVGLRHAPSFQQFGLRVLRESPVKLFSGSWFDSGSEFDGLFKMCSSGMMTDGVITDTVSGTVVDPSGMVLDGIFADTVPGTVVRPSEMVLDGIFGRSLCRSRFSSSMWLQQLCSSIKAFQLPVVPRFQTQLWVK